MKKLRIFPILLIVLLLYGCTTIYIKSASPDSSENSACFLASTNDTTDRTADILKELSTGYCKLGVGDFYVKDLQMPENSTLEGSGRSTTLICIDENASFAIKLASFGKVSNLRLIGDPNEISLSQQVGTKHGILWQGDYQKNKVAPERAVIENVCIQAFTGGGITFADTGYGLRNCVTVNNVYISACNAGINIAFWSEYNKFTNVQCVGCYYGCINNGGNNTFVNCDFSGNKLAYLMDNVQSQSPNNSHGSCVGCVFNHSDSNSGVGIHVLNCDNGFVFDACQIFFSQIIIEDSDGVTICNSNFGAKNCSITVKNGGVVLFNGNVHQEIPAINIINNDNVHFINCYVRSTGEIVGE